MSILESFMGLPLHPLLIHATVALVPLLALAGVAYALVPRLRARIGWLTVLIALAAFGSTLFTKLAGDAFRIRIVRKHLASPAILGQIDAHRHFGTITLWVTAALTLVVLALVLLRKVPPAVFVVLAALTVVLAIVSVYYVYRAGDTGARIVWTGY